MTVGAMFEDQENLGLRRRGFYSALKAQIFGGERLPVNFASGNGVRIKVEMDREEGGYRWRWASEEQIDFGDLPVATHLL